MMQYELVFYYQFITCKSLASSSSEGRTVTLHHSVDVIERNGLGLVAPS